MHPVAGDIETIQRLGSPQVQPHHPIPDVAEVAVDKRPSRQQHPPIAMPSTEVELDSEGGLLRVDAARTAITWNNAGRKYADPVTTEPHVNGARDWKGEGLSGRL